jgi:hypothetical protein
MSSPSVQHPTDRLLITFNLGKLDDSKAAAINKHLKGCPTCRRRLVSLSGATEVPSSSTTPPAVPIANAKTLAAAIAADQRGGPSPRPSKSVAWPKFVWPSAAAGTALLGLAIAWGAGVFQAKTGVTAASVENRIVTVQSEPPKVVDQPRTVSPIITQPTISSSPPAVVPDSGPSPSQGGAVKEAPKSVEMSPKPAPPTVADPPAPTTPATDKQPDNVNAPSREFFNGKDLAEWQGSHEIWKVENGSIAGSLPAGQNPSAVLSSQQKYKDFDLRFVASLADGIGDCAVQFRSQVIDPDKLQVVGPQCAIYGKDASKEHRTGSLVTEPGNKVEKSPPPKLVDRFVKPTENHFCIRCQGKHVLIEVNGVKMVNGDFPSLPDEGVIAWKIDAKRPPHKVTFKITKFTELTSLPSQNGSERPSLLDAELLKAELKFESAMRRADDVLMKHFDPEINKLQHSKSVEDKNLVPVLAHEKDLLKEKGLIPWSRPMRKAVSQFGKELRDARRTIGIAFDRAIDRAEKNHNDKLKEALLTEAAQVLAPREVATWQITDNQGVDHRTIFYSDGTFIAADKPDETNSRFWEPRFEDVIILEFPDQNDSTATNQQAFVLAPDGKTLVATTKNGEKRTWQHVED